MDEAEETDEVSPVEQPPLESSVEPEQIPSEPGIQPNTDSESDVRYFY